MFVGFNVSVAFPAGLQDFTCQLILLEDGTLALSPAGTQCLLLAFGSRAAPGLLRSKILILSEHLSKILDPNS